MDNELLSNYNRSHLLIISSYWPTRSNSISGIFVVQQVEALLKLGIKITILLTRPFGKQSIDYLSKSELGINYPNVKLVVSTGVRLPETLSSLPGWLTLNTILNGYINKLNIKKMSASNCYFDACIIHGLRYAGLSVPIWSRQINGKIAVVIHGVDPYFERAENSAKLKKLIEKTLENVDSFITVGTPLIPHLKKLGINNKTQTIANGTKITPASKVNANQRPLTDTRIILSVSNLIQLKGIDYNLRALAKIYEKRPKLKWEYRIVGDGIEKNNLVKLSKKLGISHRVMFLGRLNYEQTMNEMFYADIFSLPSWGEAFGIVYLEAMMRMKPVIGCYDNGASDIIVNNVQGMLVHPKDEDSLKNALEKLILDPELCRSLGENARKRAEKFSWEENANIILQTLYD